MKYRFEQFELDIDQQELRHNDEVVGVEPQVFSILELLIENRTRVVTKDELHDEIWANRVVTDAALNSRIRSARGAIGDDGKQQRLIKTVRDRGFRFVGEVTEASIVQTLPNLPDDVVQVDSQKPAIAILPLQMLDAHSPHNILADAISHELIAHLSSNKWLKVISRNSTFRLRGGDTDLNQISAILNVDYIGTGSLMIVGSQATISMELAHVKSAEVLWADNMTIDLDELLTLRSTLATRIVSSIEQNIQSDLASQSDRLPTERLDAWACYFRGLRHANRFNSHDNDIAGHLFQRAIDLDHEFALAHAGLSFTNFQNAFVGYRDVEEQAQAALVHAELAMEKDPLDPTVNLTMGRAKLINDHWEEAGPWFERCATMCPNNALAYYHMGLRGVITRNDPGSVDLAMQ
ncbi:MAG: winged helix-turn-helix domain-containing protein, partial [Pseudomonadota bacterium]